MHILCVDTETTGLKPGYNDLIQIGAVILDERLNRIDATEMLIKPLRPENAHPKAMEVNGLDLNKVIADGLEQNEALGIFKDWIKPHGRLTPLAQNWPFDKGFLDEWWGNMYGKIHWEYLDAKVIAIHYNVQAKIMGLPVPFPKKSLAGLCKTLEVVNEEAHKALSDAIALAEVYRKLVAYKHPVIGETIDQSRV